MKKGKYIILAAIYLVALFTSTVYAYPIDKLADAEECEEIYALEDEILEKINYGSPRGEIHSDKIVEEIDFDTAYKVYSNSELFEAGVYDKDSIMEILKDGSYIWQIPFFIEGNTILVDVFKRTEIPDDISEDVRENLASTLNQWRIGAIYVYNNRTVDFKKNIDNSLESVALDTDNYPYVFVSGLPQIRYPIAIVFDEEARFIVPAEESAVHAFKEDAKELEYQDVKATASNAYGSGRDDGFAVYEFDKVAYASKSAIPLIGAGGIGGIRKIKFFRVITCLGMMGLGVGTIAWKKLRHN